jgi:hypothetical protein
LLILDFLGIGVWGTALPKNPAAVSITNHKSAINNDSTIKDL